MEIDCIFIIFINLFKFIKHYIASTFPIDSPLVDCSLGYQFLDENLVLL